MAATQDSDQQQTSTLHHQWSAEIQAIETSLGDAPFLDVFKEDLTKDIVTEFVRDVVVAQSREKGSVQDEEEQELPGRISLNTADKGFRIHAIKLGLASLAAFLQANVTGPVLEGTDISDAIFSSAYEEYISSRGSRTNGVSNQKGQKSQKSSIESFRKTCIRSLDTDGVSVYPYIPHIELFGLARFILTSGRVLPVDPPEAWETNSDDTLAVDLSWTRLRIHLWHYKLLTPPSLGPGSLFTKSGRWTDVATLQEIIEKSLKEAETAVTTATVPELEHDLEDSVEKPEWSHQAQTQFFLEKANAYLMLGNDTIAKRALQSATESSGFLYALSGALGKRTRFQEKDISQLVVLAKSLQRSNGDSDATEHNNKSSSDPAEVAVAPTALPLNDDTLLEKIDFKGEDAAREAAREAATEAKSSTSSELPEQLRDLTPDNQPKLKPEDQIILLTEATLRDTFSPADSLTSEEILPFAVRVINDKSTNWQVYTQALLVRSRIELHRSRTLERAVLQMQAVVDQVIVDTTQTPISTSEDTAGVDDHNGSNGDSSVPSIEITTPTTNGQSITTPATTTSSNKPTSFLPAPKPTESAPAQERLRYVHALASPPRWHLESELAYAWASVGSLVSATEIFKRLHLWAEVALCLASNARSDDDQDGRGSGGEEKARAVVRWRLYHRTGNTSITAAGSSKDGVSGEEEDDDDNDDNTDIANLITSDFQGPERNPPPPNAPRLFCILGDLEENTAHYERAWEISGRRFARAQRSLGELHLRNREWAKAREAYVAAVKANRLSSEMWSRLGDIELRLGHFADAAEAFQRAIACSNGEEGGEDARTWSNLGSALLSWYREVVAEAKLEKNGGGDAGGGKENDEEGDINPTSSNPLTTTTDNENDNQTTISSTTRATLLGKRPQQLLQDALEAFKRGATIAHSNWRIWDNVVTLAASLSPNPAFDDVVLATRNVLRIRKSEDALDVDVLGLLVREVVGSPVAGGVGEGADGTEGVYEPPRGTLQRKVVELFELEVIPLLTARSEPWALISRLRAWRRDWAGALDAAEKGWRAAVGGAGTGVSGGGGGSSLVAPGSASDGQQHNKDWLQDADAWDVVVQRTGELVAAYENHGERVESIGAKWRGKARMSVRSVMSKGREAWEGSQGWGVLEGLLEGLKV